MAKTPFIRPLQIQGGTFYTFTSAAEDLAFTFNNSVNKFRFSKFALLNIPNIDTTASQENTVKLNAPDSSFIDWSTGTYVLVPGDSNIAFSQSFQSYCLNLETTITSADGYDSTLKQNVSERVFWKWMRELGAVRFKAASAQQVSPSLDQSTVTIDSNGLPVTQKRYVEGDEAYNTTGGYGLTGPYNNVVQYIGSLDIVNSVRNQDNAYSEVYIHVPTQDGSTPYVLFKNVIDTNYYPDTTWTNSPPDALDAEYLTGRSYIDTNPSGLSTLAIFDEEASGVPTVTYSDTYDGSTYTGNWYAPLDTPNSYFSDDSFVLPYNKILSKTYGAITNWEFVRSSLDSIGIDFDPDSYKEIIDNPSISTIEEFNSTADAGDFDFNCVLLYYDVFDPADETDSATNLYGVLFLDDVNSEAGDEFIPRFKKYKPNPVTKLNGNSYGFKINLKFDTDVDQTGVEQAINDYSSFSLSMFMDAMNVLQDASGTINDTASQFIFLEERVTNLEDVVLTTPQNANLEARVDSLEGSFAANQALFDNTSAVMGLINNNYELIRSVINNETSVEISYDLDLVKQGEGIQVDRSIPNELTIRNINQDYNIGANLGAGSLTQTGSNVIDLISFSNYYKHVNSGIPITLTGDLNIRINDSNVSWKVGQKFRLSFGDRIYPSAFFVNVLTDANGTYPISSPSGSAYSKNAISLDDDFFSGYDYLPVIEIICIDDQNLVFQVDAVGKSLTNNN
jgi:hypothetical protein